MIDHALRLAERGFWVFPIAPGKKSPPAISQWPEKATREPYDIYEFWTEHPGANVGIATGKWRGTGALLVVDIDVKGGRDGDLTLLDLQLQGFDFPETYTQITPTGGQHLVYWTHDLIRNGVNALGSGIDIRSAGGYIVGAGSVLDGGGIYASNELPVAEAPTWLVERLRSAHVPTPKTSPPPSVDRAQAIARATAYLRTVAPAIQGAGGDHQTFVVAAKCKDFGLSEEDTYDAMMALWNVRCEPPWSPGELDIKIRNAYKYGSLGVGAIAPEADFKPLSGGAPVPVEEPIGDPVDELNKIYGHCISGSSQCILWETTDENGKACTKYLSVDAFRGRLAPHKIQTAEGKQVPLSKVWFDSAKRRTYDAVVFDPSMKAPPRFYNMWKGFSFEPAAASTHPAVELFLDHALNNVCGGDKELCNWLIGYFAHMIQKPWEKPNVALVFKGDKGVGKNALIERVGALFSDNFLVVASKRYLTGNFNSHLERLLLFTLDEAFWSGDKQAEGTLKDLITGSTHLIERKGEEPYTVANKTRICIIGNEEWLVPASTDERRFAVFHVGNARKQDTKYFESMRVQMEQGGYPYLLAYLQQYQITTDVNVAPKTQALSDQKHESLDPVHQWWWDSLTDGVLLGSDFQTWPKQLDCETVRNAYRRYSKQRHITARAPTDRAFNRLLGRCAPSCTRGRASTLLEDGSRPYVFCFTELEGARQDWEKFIGHAVKWEG